MCVFFIIYVFIFFIRISLCSTTFNIAYCCIHYWPWFFKRVYRVCILLCVALVIKLLKHNRVCSCHILINYVCICKVLDIGAGHFFGRARATFTMCPSARPHRRSRPCLSCVSTNWLGIYSNGWAGACRRPYGFGSHPTMSSPHACKCPGRTDPPPGNYIYHHKSDESTNTHN